MSQEEKATGDAGTGTAAVTVQPEETFADEHTTEPNASQQEQISVERSAPAKWQMPKPKFQQTSGYLPQGYLQDMQAAADAAKASPGSEDTTQEQSPYVPQVTPSGTAPGILPPIEPQPDLSEQLIPEEDVTGMPVTPTAKKSGSSTVVVILGLIGILLFVAVFLTAVYFLFFAKPVVDSQF